MVALVLAAGGHALNGGALPALFTRVGGVPLIFRALRTVLDSGVVDRVIVLVDDSDIEATRRLLAGESSRVVVLSFPDEPRALLSPGLVDPELSDIVVVHDAARALAPSALVSTVVTAARGTGAVVVPVLPVSDTIKRVDRTGRVLSTSDRSGLREVQTPMALPVATLSVVTRRPATPSTTTPSAGGPSVDRPGGLRLARMSSGVELINQLPGPVCTVPGDPLAFPIRSEWDLRVAESLVTT